MKNRAVFFDRDGVINQAIVKEGKPYPPQNFEEFQWVEAVQEVLLILKKAQYILMIFTNQPDVARGQQSLAGVEAFHQHIQATLPIDQIYTCFHDNNTQCDCRKPKPGMIYQAQKDWHLDLTQCFVVGDRWRDIDAGNEAGCQTIWIDYGYQETLRSEPHFTIDHLTQTLEIIL